MTTPSGPPEHPSDPSGSPSDPYSGRPGSGASPHVPYPPAPGQEGWGYGPTDTGSGQPGGYGQQPPPYGYQPPPGYPAPGSPAPGYPAGQYAPDHPQATTSLILGILGVVVCQVLGPFAWSMGKRTLREIDESNGALGGRGAANAGYILGIVATVLLIFSLLALVFAFGVLGLTAVSSGDMYG